MGRKERQIYADREKIDELINKPELTEEDIQFIKDKWRGSGALTSNHFAMGQYFTPKEVCRFMVELANLMPGDLVLEPACGGGAILEEIPEYCDIHAIEFNRSTFNIVERLYPNVAIYNEDTLETGWEEKFDCVIMNPPYGLKVDNWDFACGKKLKSEVAFLEYGLQQLKEGGYLIALIPDSVLANSKEAAFRKWALEENRLVASISLPTTTFYEARTNVKTSILVFKKGRIQDDYEVFMAMVKDLGWDSRGRATNKSDLPGILEAYRRFFAKNEHKDLYLASPLPVEQSNREKHRLISYIERHLPDVPEDLITDIQMIPAELDTFAGVPFFDMTNMTRDQWQTGLKAILGEDVLDSMRESIQRA